MNKSLIELLREPHDKGFKPESLRPATAILEHEFSLYHIKEVTFDEDSPRKEAFENVLNALSIEGITFVYLLMGDKEQVGFYFGIARDKRYPKALELDVDEIGQAILKPSLEGNFRGSVVAKMGKRQRENIRGLLSDFTHVGKLEGVPSVNEDNEEFQGIDRLVDIMSGDQFCLAVMADPLSLLEINDIENQLYTIYDKLLPLAKKSLQEGKNSGKTTGTSDNKSTTDTTGTNDSRTITTSDGTSDSTTKGTSDSTTKGTNDSITKGTSDSGSSKSTNSSRTEATNNGRTEGTSNSRTEGSNKGNSDARAKGTSTSKAVGLSTSTNQSLQTGESTSETREFADKQVQDWLKYIDEVLLKRVQHGKNKGLYLSNIYLFANSAESVLKLGNTARAIFSGGTMNKSPLAFRKVTGKHEIDSIKNFQFPAFADQTTISTSQKQFDLLMSYSPMHRFQSNWLSTEELSVVAGLPQKEVVGLMLKEEVEFGLNINTKVNEENQLYLGSLVKSGLIQPIDVNIDRCDLDKHTFIAGVTGSGKTTTCQRLLESARMPFLVIEPAKTEYRVLTKKNKDILIFTLGNDNIAPFRLNPFEFFPHENITSRVDMIKASIESAFDMEAAIPQLIEAAIYHCYQDKGWNIATSRNARYADPFAPGVYAFPTLSDLLHMTEVVVDEQGFDDRLKQDYIGSIRARLQGLLIGAKGLMLDTPRSINFKELALRSVILELEEIRNPSEKSLIMGFILANLNEAIRANYEEFRKRGERFRHITLIEEAHRLLSKYEPGDSKNKKQGVEAFADMLAEVRKYGESLIIVDQIPNKLTPEVLKNTNTKIIHKLFARDDKEAVGNTMALSEEQMDFLSNLEPGRAILSGTGLNKPVQIQIKEVVSTTQEEEVAPEQIAELAFNFYAQNYQSGLIPGLEHLPRAPERQEVQAFLRGEVADAWHNTVMGSKPPKPTPELVNYVKAYGAEFMRDYILMACYKPDASAERTTQHERLTVYLSGLLSDENKRFEPNDQNAFRKNIKVVV